jgi:hypothetical protein
MKVGLAGAVGLSAVVFAGVVHAQSMGHDKMDAMKPKAESCIGCVASGATRGSYTLTHVMEEKSQGIDHNGMDHNDMHRDDMHHDAIAMAALNITSKKVDLASYVGRRIQVSGTATGQDGMSPVFTIKSFKVLSASCQ